MGVTPKLDKDQRDAKSILEHIFFHLVEFKKLNQVRTVQVLHTVCANIKFWFLFLQENDLDTEPQLMTRDS